MNHGQRRNRKKKQYLPLRWRSSWDRRKKARGKVKRQHCAIKVHAVTDTDFLLSTSFAMYRIPRTDVALGSMFAKANQKEIQNVVGVRHSRYPETLRFVWGDLEEWVYPEELEPFKIANKGKDETI